MRGRERRLRTVATRMTVRQRVAALLAAGPDRAAPHDDIGRGLTPAGWAELHRYADRLDQLNATARDCLARAASEITDCQTVASMFATARLSVVLGEQLEDTLDVWSQRRGPGGAADQDLDGAVRTIAGVLRRAEEDLGDAGAVRTIAGVLRRAEEDLGDAGAGDTVLRPGLLGVHHLLRALAIEVATFAPDLGADPLAAELHACADRRRAELAALIDVVKLDPPVALTEPSDEYVAGIAARCRPEEGADAAPW